MAESYVKKEPTQIIDTERDIHQQHYFFYHKIHLKYLNIRLITNELNRGKNIKGMYAKSYLNLHW